MFKLTRLSFQQAQKLILPTLNQNSAYVLCVRGKATGDNSEPYVPKETGFTREFVADIVRCPPLVPTLEEKLCHNLDEVKKTLEENQVEDAFVTWFGKNMPTIEDDKDPARDLVNFPRPKPVVHPEGRRLFLIPDSWFRAMYHKTGVTGPYVLTAGFLTFLMSKEYLIYETEMNIGVYLCVIIAIAMNKFSDKVFTYCNNVRETSNWLWYSWQKDAIVRLNEYVDSIKKAQESLKGQDILFDAKRENVALQREAEYRRRLKMVHDEVKRKLDYQVASDQAKTQFEQTHMANWILRSVEEAVAKQSEKDVLAKCINDLKVLSSSRKGAI